MNEVIVINYDAPEEPMVLVEDYAAAGEAILAASKAKVSEQNAAQSENNAGNFATDAENSKIAASNSAAAASNSASAAAQSEADAQSLVDDLQPFNIFPEAEIIAWDNFKTDSADIAGRVAPKGGTWECFDILGNNITGIGSVTGGSLTIDTMTRLTLTMLPVSDANGLFFQGVLQRRSFAATSVGLVIKSTSGNFIRINSGDKLAISKTIAGVLTVLKTVSESNYSIGVNDAKAIAPFNLSLSKVVPFYTIVGNFSGFGIGLTTSDSDVVDILDNISHVGISGFRGYGAYGVQIVKIP